MIKNFFCAIVLLISFVWSARAALPQTEASRIADAIFVIEGGAKAKVPYGILSMKVRNEEHARQICINTIQNTHARWIKSGKPGEFLHFLANRYCPPSDSAGNRNWKKNIKWALNQKNGTRRNGNS